MKLLKGFIRSSHADAVVKALEAEGAPGITLSREHGVGYGYDPLTFTLAPSAVAQAPSIVKVEVVCEDADADRLLEVLMLAARTGYRGDGIVFVTPVERAIKIRTGSEGLQSRQKEETP